MAEKIKGLAEAIKNVRALGAIGTLGMGQLLTNFGNTQIVAPAKRKYTPVVTGNLRSTIMAQPPSYSGLRVKVLITAGGPAAPYALKVHENPRSGMTGGYGPYGRTNKNGQATRAKYKKFSKVGQWKYLETPAQLAIKGSQAWLQKEASLIVKELRKLGVR